MKKVFWSAYLTCFLLLGFGIGRSQVPPVNYVDVIGNATDPASQAWGYGGVTITYFNPSSTQPPVWIQTGQPVPQSSLVQTTQMDNNGNFEFTQVPDNNSMSPQGSGYKITLCPTASTPCQTSPNAITITGNTQINASAFINAFIATPVINPGTITLAYNESEINTPVVGAAYIDMNPNDASFLSLYSWDGFEWNPIVNSQGVTPAACNTLDNTVSHYICNNVGNQIINPGNLQLQDNSQAWLELGSFANGPPGTDNNLYVWEGGPFSGFIGQAHFDNDYGIDPSNVGNTYFTNTYGDFIFAMGNLGTNPFVIDKTTGQATFLYQLNGSVSVVTPLVNATTELETPKIVLNGGTPITGQSAAQSQVVTCPTGGTSNQFCGADGAWHTPATQYTPPAFTGTSGYQTESSGLIEEWVTGPNESANFSGPVTVTLPHTFPTACLPVSVQLSTTVSASPTGNGSAYTNYMQSCTTSSVTVWMDVGPDGVGSATHAVLIRILGY